MALRESAGPGHGASSKILLPSVLVALAIGFLTGRALGPRGAPEAPVAVVEEAAGVPAYRSEAQFPAGWIKSAQLVNVAGKKGCQGIGRVCLLRHSNWPRIAVGSELRKEQSRRGAPTLRRTVVFSRYGSSRQPGKSRRAPEPRQVGTEARPPTGGCGGPRPGCLAASDPAPPARLRQSSALAGERAPESSP